MYNIFRIILSVIAISLIINSCSRHMVFYMPDMQSSIVYEQFHQHTIQMLLAEPLNLKIDTAYKNMIIASDLYDGNIRKKWFFWETQWKEKVIYSIQYLDNQDGVSYSIEVRAEEAPNENYQQWRKVFPSRATKEKHLILKLSRNE